MAAPGAAPGSIQADGESREQLLRLHIAEYQALMAKSTALVNLMFTTMGVAFVFLGYMITIWPGNEQRVQILWVALLVEQVIILFSLGLLQREYGIVFYIETQLRESCRSVTAAGAKFWSYESFLRGRLSILDRLMTWLPLLISVSAMVSVISFRWQYLLQPWSKWDCVALGMSLALTGWTFKNSHSLSKRKACLSPND